MKSIILVLCSSAVISALPFSPSLKASDIASPVDRTFVAKVSQGGMYEVEASKVAEQRATARDVSDMAITEIHDHTLVNRELTRVAKSEEIDVASQLNASFQERLTQLKSVSGAAFDTAYVADMAQIHDMDEKLFAKEVVEGSSDFKTFAATTDLIVKRHIGAIHDTDEK